MKKIFALGILLLLLMSRGYAQDENVLKSEEDTGAVVFTSSDKTLNQTYLWARKQALAYAFEGDPVGLWYEAALPGREAFCMRDVSHQSFGAHVLGLDAYNNNMFFQFAAHISNSQDWCSYWEINRYGEPAPVDYYSDDAFWYNLPANFDLMDAMYRMFTWTGDQSYFNDPVLLNFYKRSVHDYVHRWDLELDQIMKRKRIMNQSGGIKETNRFQYARGIPGYDESDPNYVLGLDQLAVQYAGYKAYGKLMAMKGDESESETFLKKARQVRNFINTKWWDDQNKHYYSVLDTSYTMKHMGNLSRSVLYFHVAEGEGQIKSVLNEIKSYIAQASLDRVEILSHLPEILFNYEQNESAFKLLNRLPESRRRAYPEVSYSIMGSLVKGLMGIKVTLQAPIEAIQQGGYNYQVISTKPRIYGSTGWAEIKHG